MIRKLRAAVRLAMLSSFAATALSAHAMTFVVGDTYTSNYFSRTISHYDKAGTLVDSMELPAAYGSEVRGMAFGKDGLLYAVTVTDSGMGVVALDANGTVRASYSGPGYIAGNLSYGKITFGNDGSFYVAGADDLVKFTPGQPTGTIVHTDNQMFDVTTMPSGDLLALSAYGIQELAPSGATVRAIDPNVFLVDARGIAYDAAHNDLFVTMLGDSDEFFRLLRLDATTGQVEKDVTFWYGDDIFLTADHRLLVGSRTLAPEYFDLDLNALGALGTQQQMFVTQMPSPVPEAPTALMLASGLLVMLGLARRRARGH